MFRTIITHKCTGDWVDFVCVHVYNHTHTHALTHQQYILQIQYKVLMINLDIQASILSHSNRMTLSDHKFPEPPYIYITGSDHPHLVTPTEPVRLGPPGGPADNHTRLGWTLQGPSSVICRLNSPKQCLLTSVPPPLSELMKHVEKLWQTDVIPLRSSKVVTRSQEDNFAVSLLEDKTTCVEVDGILRRGRRPSE